MLESVKCRSCAGRTEMDGAEIGRLTRSGEIDDHGKIDAGRYESGGRNLLWVCPACRSLAVNARPATIAEQMARVRRGQLRLEAAGKPRAEAISRAVESQMDEDERRRFPSFYAWRRESVLEMGPNPGAFVPPENPIEPAAVTWP